MKNVIYLIKYEKEYYAPYQTIHPSNSDIRKLFSSNRNLAVPFPNKKVASYFIRLEKRLHSYCHQKFPFDPSKLKIVKISKKKHV